MLERFNDNLNQIEDYNSYIGKIESQIDNSEQLSKIASNIKLLESKIDKLPNITSDFTSLLFEENWILKKFEKIQDQFCDQVSELITNKQKLESKHNFEKGEKHAIALTLLNNKSPLPLNMPSMHVMHEMISDEICKVCNREAK